MIDRQIKSELIELIDSNPAVVLTGPRQVGKTTLAREIAKVRAAIYLDLERPVDLTKINDIEAYCALNPGKLLILDEIQRAPELFAPLRGIIDQRRRQGQKTGQFLFLGSASIDLLRQSSETLAGRIAYLELSPVTASDIDLEGLNALWLRGGFPESYLAPNAKKSMQWRQSFISTYLERDISQLGPRIPAQTLRRFWTMLAHNQGEIFNAAAFARGLDVKGITTARYLDLMVDLLLVRRLQPWVSNLGRRLVKAPKVYVRDSGLCHALLGISALDDLLGHPVLGGSWEGFVIENILNHAPPDTQAGFYRTTGGAEIDLVIEPVPGESWAIEVKRSSAPKVSKGFYSACGDISPRRKFVVYNGQESFPMKGGVTATGLGGLIEQLKNIQDQDDL